MAKALLLVLLTACALPATRATAQERNPGPTKTAVFAGGCFWCMQPPFDRTKGVVKTIVGYTGGKESDANYSAVSGHRTEHREAIQVTYD
ncbi:MAG: peptide-methionine (S)-S-oxide reductase, partial [Chthoniobacterales bacterium]